MLGTVIAMSAPQIIGAHQPDQACNEYTLTYTVLKAQSQPGGRGGTAVGSAEPHCQNPAA